MSPRASRLQSLESCGRTEVVAWRSEPLWLRQEKAENSNTLNSSLRCSRFLIGRGVNQVLLCANEGVTEVIVAIRSSETRMRVLGFTHRREGRGGTRLPRGGDAHRL